MTHTKFHQLLEPKNWGTFEVESFKEYHDRVKHLLPKFPEDVMKSWIYRHYVDAISHYGWLDFMAFRFTLESWTNNHIYENVNTHKMDSVVELISHHVYGHNWLQQYFADNQTWNVPIIILRNKDNLKTPYGEQLGKPYHLIEGHRRLGYFRRLYRDDKSKIQDTHKLWIVDI